MAYQESSRVVNRRAFLRVVAGAATGAVVAGGIPAIVAAQKAPSFPKGTTLKILEWVTLGIVVALAVSSFYAAMHAKVHKNVILSSTLNRYILGLVMSAVNPVQIPFWFGWSTVQLTKKILLPRMDHFNS